MFVVEQDCAYLDADGRDAEPDALHLWIDEPDAPTVSACLRILSEPDGRTSIGRVVTAPAMRGRSLASALLLRALASGDGPFVLKAQARLVGWYAAFGFVVSGPEFIEDGILHRPMERGPRTPERML